MNVVLAAASGPMCENQQVLVTLRSFQKNVPNARMVFITGDMTTKAQDRCNRYGVEVHRVKADFRDYGNKQRWWHLGEYAARRLKPDDVVLSIDARDTLFQTNPFEYGPLQAACGLGRVLVSAEAVPFSGCPWNAGDAKRLIQSLRGPAQVYSSAWPVINGGFVAGSARDFAWLALARFAFDAKESGATDQATLAFLAHWTADWNLVEVIPAARAWVAHGHHYQTWSRLIQDGETIVKNVTGMPYCVVHQWDRQQVPEHFRNHVLATYGTEATS